MAQILCDLILELSRVFCRISAHMVEIVDRTNVCLACSGVEMPIQKNCIHHEFLAFQLYTAKQFLFCTVVWKEEIYLCPYYQRCDKSMSYVTGFELHKAIFDTCLRPSQ